jgi:hypothetical protein
MRSSARRMSLAGPSGIFLIVQRACATCQAMSRRISPDSLAATISGRFSPPAEKLIDAYDAPQYKAPQHGLLRMVRPYLRVILSPGAPESLRAWIVARPGENVLGEALIGSVRNCYRAFPSPRMNSQSS